MYAVFAPTSNVSHIHCCIANGSRRLRLPIVSCGPTSTVLIMCSPEVALTMVAVKVCSRLTSESGSPRPSWSASVLVQPYEWIQNEWIQPMQGQKLPQVAAIWLMSVEHASSLQLFAVFEIIGMLAPPATAYQTLHSSVAKSSDGSLNRVAWKHPACHADFMRTLLLVCKR